MQVLDTNFFPSGKLYFYNQDYMNKVSAGTLKPVIAHANFMYGHDKKREMLTARGLWLHDDV